MIAMVSPPSGAQIFVMKEPWLNLLLSGAKTMEIRGARLAGGDEDRDRRLRGGHARLYVQHHQQRGVVEEQPAPRRERRQRDAACGQHEELQRDRRDDRHEDGRDAVCKSLYGCLARLRVCDTIFLRESGAADVAVGAAAWLIAVAVRCVWN